MSITALCPTIKVLEFLLLRQYVNSILKTHYLVDYDGDFPKFLLKSAQIVLTYKWNKLQLSVNDTLYVAY